MTVRNKGFTFGFHGPSTRLQLDSSKTTIYPLPVEEGPEPEPSPNAIYFTGAMPSWLRYSLDTSASFQTGASAINWKAPHVPRYEDIGDGSGSAILLERQTVNEFWNPTDGQLFDGGGDIWEEKGTATSVFSGTFIDGLNNAYTIAFGTFATDRMTYQTSTFDPDYTRTISIWVQNDTGDGSWAFRLRDLDNNLHTSPENVATSDWQRFDFSIFSATGSATALIHDVKNWNGNNRVFNMGGPQLERHPFATSYIGTGSFRGVTVLSGSSLSAPLWYGRTGTINAEYKVRMLYNSDELTASVTGSNLSFKDSIGAWDSGHYWLHLYSTGNMTTLRFQSGSTLFSASTHIKFSKGQWVYFGIDTRSSLTLTIKSATAGNAEYDFGAINIYHTDPGTVWIGTYYSASMMGAIRSVKEIS